MERIESAIPEDNPIRSRVWTPETLQPAHSLETGDGVVPGEDIIPYRQGMVSGSPPFLCMEAHHGQTFVALFLPSLSAILHPEKGEKEKAPAIGLLFMLVLKNNL